MRIAEGNLSIIAFLAVALFILHLPVAAAQAVDYNIQKTEITLDIGADSSVTQTIKFYFSGPVGPGSLNYSLNEAARNIGVADDFKSLSYELNGNSVYSIDIFLENPTNTLAISYVTDGVVFRSGSIDYFFTEFNFEKEIPLITAQIKLPAGYAVYQNSYRPSNASIISDGQRIILVWELPNTPAAALSVKFSGISGENSILGIIALFLAGLVVFLYLYYRRKTKDAFIHGFREDEQKTIKYLEQKKIAFQKDLESEFKFSRAKATRVVARLVEKGLVRKQKYGRTNKLTWLK